MPHIPTHDGKSPLQGLLEQAAEFRTARMAERDAIREARAEALAQKSALAGSTNYLNNLRVLQAGLRATAAGVIDPAIQANIARILGERGMATDELGKALAGGAFTIPAGEALTIAGEVATELTEFQSAVRAAKAGVPRVPSTTSAIIGGAAEGATAGVAGGPIGMGIGAAFGAVGGLFGNKAAKKNARRARNAVNEAARLASPENFQANLDKVMEASRLQTFASGQQAELAQEAAISSGGLRGTGIGTQASIGAAVAPQVAALRKAAGTANVAVGLGVNERLMTPVRPASTALADALGAAAGLAGSLLSPEAIRRRRLTAMNNRVGYTDPLISQPTVGEVG